MRINQNKLRLPSFFDSYEVIASLTPGRIQDRKRQEAGKRRKLYSFLVIVMVTCDSLSVLEKKTRRIGKKRKEKKEACVCMWWSVIRGRIKIHPLLSYLSKVYFVYPCPVEFRFSDGSPASYKYER